MLMQVRPVQANDEKAVYVEAYACSEYGDGPRFAKLLVGTEFVGKLRKLSALCTEHGLSELRVYDSPELWGPGDVEGELRLTCAEMVVTSSSFWFVDTPKNGNYHIETRAQDIETFLKAVDSVPLGVASYFGDSPDDIEEAVKEEGLESDDADDAPGTGSAVVPASVFDGPAEYFDHAHIQTAEHARLFKTGWLKLPGHDAVCVAVRFASFQQHDHWKRPDAVFEVLQGGKFVGHYFASAFKSLCL